MNDEIGKIETQKSFWKIKWIVFTGKDENKIERAVEFNDFENAQIFSELVKLKECVKPVRGKE